MLSVVIEKSREVAAPFRVRGFKRRLKPAATQIALLRSQSHD